MTSNDPSVVTLALRGAVSPNPVTQPTDLVGILRESAERLLFQAAAIAPAGGVVSRALERIASEGDLDGVEDDDLLVLWEGAMRSEVVAFSNRPESWDDPESTEFKERCAMVFGVDDDLVPRLVQRFHGLSEGARFGIFLIIERSALFSYLTREIDADEESRPVENPNESFKSLIRQVFGAA